MTADAHQRQAFETLYDQYFKRIFLFARKHTGDEDEAADLAQEVFLKLWLNQDSFAKHISAEAQLLTIARQLIINRYKKELVRQKAYKSWHQDKSDIALSETSDQSLLEEELHQRYKAALNELPPKRREIFEKSRIEGLSYEQIARDLSISTSTVESQMVKALRLMRGKLLLLLLPFFS